MRTRRPAPGSGAAGAAAAAAAAARRAAEAYATKTEKLTHVFADRHRLEPLVRQYGSQEGS